MNDSDFYASLGELVMIPVFIFLVYLGIQMLAWIAGKLDGKK